MKIKEQIRKTQISIFVIVGIIAFALLVLIYLFNRAVINVVIVPANAYATVDNRPIDLNAKGEGSLVLSPGNYTLKVEADGYISKIEEVRLRRAFSTKFEINLDKMPTPYQIGDNKEVASNVQFISGADDFNSIFYLGNNASTLYKARINIKDDGQLETIYNRAVSNPPLSGIQNIIWSPKKDAAIFRKADGIYFFDFQKFNFVSQEEKKFGNNIGDIAWSPDDSKIAYYYAPPSGERSLIFSNKTNSDKTRVANLAEMGIENPYLSWSPDSEWLIVIPRNKDFNTNKIYLFNAYTRSFKTIDDSGNHLGAEFSSDGSRILYSTYIADQSFPVKSTLSVMDKDGNNKRNLDLRASIGKTLWLNNSQSGIIVSTYDSDKKGESIFGFDVDKKEKSSFQLNLAGKSYVKEMSLSQNNNLLFYIANEQFYVVGIKK